MFQIASLFSGLIGENDTLQKTIADKIHEIEVLKAVMTTESRSRTTSETEADQVCARRIVRIICVCGPKRTLACLFCRCGVFSFSSLVPCVQLKESNSDATRDSDTQTEAAASATTAAAPGENGNSL